MDNAIPRYEEMALSNIEIGDYACHVLNDDLVKLYVREPNRLFLLIPLVSERDDKYFLIRNFEAFEAMKKIGQKNTHVQIAKLDSLDEEIEKYRQLNAESIPDVVDAIKQELSKMSVEYSFMDIIYKMACYSRNTFDRFFDMLWYYIPDEYLYQTYKDVFDDAAQWFYSRLCENDIISKIHKLNKYDTVNNSILIEMLDKDGYLTIYHGHIKKTLKNSHSWTIDKDIAHFFGCRNASKNSVDDYYVVTGKVKLEDVIAFITQRSEKEIVVLNKHVKNKHKEFFKHSESNGKYRMFDASNKEKIEQLSE